MRRGILRSGIEVVLFSSRNTTIVFGVYLKAALWYTSSVWERITSIPKWNRGSPFQLEGYHYCLWGIPRLFDEKATLVYLFSTVRGIHQILNRGIKTNSNPNLGYPNPNRRHRRLLQIPFIPRKVLRGGGQGRRAGELQYWHTKRSLAEASRFLCCKVTLQTISSIVAKRRKHSS